MKLIFSSFTLLLLAFFSACDDCPTDLSSEYVFNLEVIDSATGHNLFLGNGSIYTSSDFELYILKSDSLQHYEYYTSSSEVFYTVSMSSGFSPNIYGNITDTFYLKTPHSILDTLTFQFNETMTACYGNVVTSYDVRQNGNLICDDCTIKDKILIFK